jgi:cytochrome c oxidase cbb3-type subunit 3
VTGRTTVCAAVALLATGCTGGPVQERLGPETQTRFAIGPIPGPQKPSQPLPNPHGDGDAARTDGRRWFIRYNCSGCHGGHGGGGMGPSLRDVDWIYGSSDAAIFSSISEGRGKGMPSWGGHIPDEQIWNLVSYIRSLRTSGEADPPT